MVSQCVVELTARDSATDPESVERLKPDERITYPPMSDPPLPPINNTDPCIVLSELEVKLSALLLLPADELADRVSSPPFLTNNPPPTIVAAPSLLSEDDPDTKLNNPPSTSDDKSTLIKIDPPVPLSPESTTTLTYPSVPDDATPVLVKALSLSPVSEFPLFNLTNVVLVLLKV